MLSPKRLLAGASVVAAISVCAAAYALSHPNFQAADDAIENAISRIRAAQEANGPNFGDHAARAIQLLQDARGELRIADEYHRGIR